MSAVVALAMGVGLAAGAQAHGTYSRQSAMPGADMHAGTSGPARQAAMPQHKQSRQEVMKTQRMLKAKGLYKGHIDGIMGPKTRTALTRFHQENGVAMKKGTHRTAQQKRMQPAPKVGVGSSMPQNNNNMTSGSSSSIAPIPPAPSSTQNPSAGGADQNLNR